MSVPSPLMRICGAQKEKPAGRHKKQYNHLRKTTMTHPTGQCTQFLLIGLQYMAFYVSFSAV